MIAKGVFFFVAVYNKKIFLFLFPGFSLNHEPIGALSNISCNSCICQPYIKITKAPMTSWKSVKIDISGQPPWTFP